MVSLPCILAGFLISSTIEDDSCTSSAIMEALPRRLTQLAGSKRLAGLRSLKHFHLVLFFLRFYLFIFRQRRGVGEREENFTVWLPLMCPLLGTWPITQACALTRNRTSDPLVRRPALRPLNHPHQGPPGSLQKNFANF